MHDGFVRMCAIVGVAVMSFVLAACTGGSSDDTPLPSPSPGADATSATAPPALVVTDLDSFTAGLEAAGHKVRVGVRTGLEDIFGVQGHPVSFDVARVMAFDYPNEKAAERLQASVDTTADMVGPAIIEWSNPHLYRAGSLIVVYLRDKPAAIRTIEGLLGPHFAPR